MGADGDSPGIRTVVRAASRIQRICTAMGPVGRISDEYLRCRIEYLAAGKLNPGLGKENPLDELRLVRGDQAVDGETGGGVRKTAADQGRSP